MVVIMETDIRRIKCPYCESQYVTITLYEPKKVTVSKGNRVRVIETKLVRDVIIDCEDCNQSERIQVELA